MLWQRCLRQVQGTKRGEKNLEKEPWHKSDPASANAYRQRLPVLHVELARSQGHQFQVWLCHFQAQGQQERLALNHSFLICNKET